MKATILIDIDDVTAQFRKKFLELVNEELQLPHTMEMCSSEWECEKSLKLTVEQNDKIWSIVHGRGFAQTLELMPGAGDAIEYLTSKHEVVFVTHQPRHSETWVSDRTTWVEKHFGRQMADNLIFTGAKHHVDGDVFIDDRTDHLNAWHARRLERGHQNYVPRAVVYHWPYNMAASYPTFRTYSWQGVREFIEATCW